jgi:hypothetical protein
MVVLRAIRPESCALRAAGLQLRVARACLLILLNRSAGVEAASSWRFDVSPAASLEQKKATKSSSERFRAYLVFIFSS